MGEPIAGWEPVRLSEIVERRTERNSVGNTRVLTISAAQGLVDQAEYFNRIVASKDLSPYFLLQRGDFAYNKSYSVGYPVGVVRRLDRYDAGVVSPLYICFRPRAGSVDSDFLEQMLRAGRLDGGIVWIAKEGARNHGLLNVGSADFFGLELEVPPLEEQRRIAEILDTIDENIQATERLIAKLNQMYVGMRRSRFAELLATSDHRKVGDCFDMILGKMLSPASKTGTRPAPYLANRNVQWGRCRIDDLDEMDFSESERRKFALVVGDVLVCEGGEVGRTAIWRGELDECYFQKAIHRLRTRGDVVPDFMLHFMRHAAELDLFRSHTSQTSIAHLTGEQLARVPIPVPPMETQRELVGALAGVADRLDAENAELAKVRAIRVGLAADLLSGRVRTVAA